MARAVFSCGGRASARRGQRRRQITGQTAEPTRLDAKRHSRSGHSRSGHSRSGHSRLRPLPPILSSSFASRCAMRAMAPLISGRHSSLRASSRIPTNRGLVCVVVMLSGTIINNISGLTRIRKARSLASQPPKTCSPGQITIFVWRLTNMARYGVLTPSKRQGIQCRKRRCMSCFASSSSCGATPRRNPPPVGRRPA